MHYESVEEKILFKCLLLISGEHFNMHNNKVFWCDRLMRKTAKQGNGYK